MQGRSTSQAKNISMLIDRENANYSCWKLMGLSFVQFKATHSTIMFVAVHFSYYSSLYYLKLMLYCRHDEQFLIPVFLWVCSLSLSLCFFLQSSYFWCHLFKFNVKERVVYQLFGCNSRIDN